MRHQLARLCVQTQSRSNGCDSASGTEGNSGVEYSGKGGDGEQNTEREAGTTNSPPRSLQRACRADFCPRCISGPRIVMGWINKLHALFGGHRFVRRPSLLCDDLKTMIVSEKIRDATLLARWKRRPVASMDELIAVFNA